MSKKRFEGSCTTILAGKKATIDGSTLIARNEDGHEALDPQRFIVVQPKDQPRHYKSVLSDLELDLPENPMRYTAVPNAIPDQGIWAAAGFNSENVGMSATETITTNPRIQGLDPYVNAIGEEDIVTITLPYIHSAREGVERLGALLEKYGTYEPNGIGFMDKDEVWWLETIGGHHWAAVRIPDDAVVVAPNRMNIDDFDFDSEDTLCSADLKSLIDDNNLNPDYTGYNLRHIFGTSSIKDTVYNNPRTWYGQNFFGLESFDPYDHELPFIFKADRKISIEDVKFIESSHYEQTEFDPYGTTNTPAEKKLVRPIGLNRNHQLHILQMRNNVPAEIAAVQWIAFGCNTFNNVVPFYANVEDTPAPYRDATATFDLNNMYWLSSLTALVGDHNYNFYVDMRDNNALEAESLFRGIQNATDKEGAKADLTAANEKLAAEALRLQTELLGEMTKRGSNKMTLRFDFND